MSNLLDSYDGPFDPSVGLADFSRRALARLGREYLLHGHLQDRVGIPLVLARHSRQDMLDVAIEEWMAASPIYSLRSQRALNFGNGDVPTIFKNIQLDIGAPHQFMDFRYKVADANHGEFWLDHCGALMDVEPMGEEFVQGMCHDIEDPTFDATVGATNPHAEVRPIHHIHAAETQEERALIKSRYGKTPIRYLDNLQVLDPHTVVVHAIHVDSEEIELLAQTRTGVAHCPESNMKLASGIAPVVEMLEKEVLVGLGTDGCASNNDLDMFKEMDTAAKLQKVRYLEPTVMNARTVLRLATIEGARVLGLEKEIGSLEIGKKADIIFLDLNQPHLVPCYDPFSLLVYSAKGSDVHSVMIEGRMVMENRKILNFNMDEVMDQVVGSAGELFRRIKAIQQYAEQRGFFLSR